MYFKRFLILCGIFLIFSPCYSRVLARLKSPVAQKTQSYRAIHLSHLSNRQRIFHVLDKDIPYLIQSSDSYFETYIKNIRSDIFQKSLLFRLIAHPSFNSFKKLDIVLNHFKVLDPDFKIYKLKDKNDYNMIHLSVIHSKTDFIDYFEEKGVYLNETAKGLSPLFLSIKESKSEEVVMHLLNKSEEDAITITDYEANTILHYLAGSNYPSLKVFSYLKDNLKYFSIKKLANSKNSSGLTPLAYSFKKLGKIYDQNIRQSESEEKIELIKALIPITNLSLKYHDEYIIHIASQYSTKLEVFKLLVQKMKENNLSLNLRGYKKRTPLNYVAAFNSNPDILRFMIEEGAPVNVKDSENRSPLRSATRMSRNIDFVEILLDHHASLKTLDHHKKTPVYWFLRNKYFKKSPKFQEIKDRMLSRVQKPAYYRPEPPVH